LIAKDVKVQVEFNPQLVTAFRLLGYEDRAIADSNFRNDIIDAGEIGADHQVTALYELVLTGKGVPQAQGAPEPESGAAFDGQAEVAPEDLVLVKLRFKQPDAGESDPAAEVKASLAPAAIAGAGAPLDSDLSWAASVAAFAEILKGSPYATPAHLTELEATFTEQAHTDTDRTEFLELFTRARSLLPAR
jgi:Ca-activated chloride channel family protein